MEMNFKVKQKIKQKGKKKGKKKLKIVNPAIHSHLKTVPRSVKD